MATANELTDARIPFISLVRKGANGVPLHELKRDGAEGNADVAAALSGVLATVSKGEPAAAVKDTAEPAIVFFSASAEEAAGALEEVLTTLGFKTDNIQDTEHGLVFMQMDTVPADIMMVELEPGVHAAVTGVATKKADLYGCSMEDATDFEKVLGTEGAVPMVHVVMSAVNTVIGASLRQAKTASDAKQNVGAALRGAATYLERIIDSIPVAAFKVAEELADLEVAPEGEDEADPAKKGDDGKPAAAADPAAAVADPKPEEKPATEQKGAEPAAAAAADADKDKPAAAAAADPAPVVEAPKSAGAVIDTDAIIQAVTKAVEQKLEPIKGTVQALQEQVQKSDARIDSRLVGGRGHGDEPSRTAKGDQPGNGSDDFSFDTGTGRRP